MERNHRPDDGSRGQGDDLLTPHRGPASGRRLRRHGNRRRIADQRTAVPLVEAWSALRDAMVLASPGTKDERPAVLAANEAFRTLFGLSEGEAEGRDLVPFLDPPDEPAFLSQLRAMIEGERGSMSSLTVLRDVPDEQAEPTLLEWELAPVRDAGARATSVIAVLGDARAETVSRSIHAEIRAEGAPETSSREHLLRRIERSLERLHRRPAYGFAVLGLEVRGQREMRRRLGGVVGDAIVDALARRVRRSLRPSDVIARLDGQRLAVLLDGFSSEGGLGAVIERSQEAAEAPFRFGGEKVWGSGVEATGFVYNGEHPPRSAREVLRRLG